MNATKAPAIETYREAVEQLTIAVNALDQAHAMLKDIDLDNYISTKSWGRHMSILDAVAIADKLLYELQHVTCDNCGKPMSEINECLEGTCQGDTPRSNSTASDMAYRQEGPNNG